MTPKARGDQWERDVVTALRGHGFPLAERRLRLGAHDDRGDIDGFPGWLMECKDTHALRLPEWIDEAKYEAGQHIYRPVPVLIVKRRGHAANRAYVVMELADFATEVLGQ